MNNQRQIISYIVGSDNKKRGEYLKPSGVSIDEVIKVTHSLLKGAEITHVHQVTQALLKHYFAWLPYRRIAELCETKDHAVIPKNIAKVKSNKYLNSLFTDLRDIFDTK